MAFRSVSPRILAVHLPWWPTERLALRSPETRDAFFVTITEDRGRVIIAAASVRAFRSGLVPGMSLADGRAIVPSVAVRRADPSGDARALERLARWADRFTPRVVPADPDTLFLDVGGSAHLFGGEEALAASLRGELEGFGLTSRMALADTLGAAWGLARYGQNDLAVVPPAAEPSAVKEALAKLPVAALRLDADVAEDLASFGLDRIRALVAVEPAELDERFGSAPSRRLAQALGLLQEPLTSLRPRLPREARLAFADPISLPESIRAAVEGLLDDLCLRLSRTGEGVRQLRLVCHRVDGGRQTLTIGTSRPSRRREVLADLFAETLGQVEPGFGIEELVLAADGVEAVEDVQTGWIPDSAPGPRMRPTTGGAAVQTRWGTALTGNRALGGEKLARFLDRMGNRFGFDRIVCPVPRESWLPERAVRRCRPLAGPPVSVPDWPEGRRRPLRLLSPPETVEVVSSESGGRPVLLRRRSRAHRVWAADGPERLECEWWRQDAPPRDYYRVADEEGRRYWLYREGPRGPGSPPRWFLHGLFG